jgi:hypothetical protein
VDYAACAFIYCQNGVLDSVTGLDRLKADGTIDHYFLYKTKGMAFTQAKTSGDRAAGYIVTANTEESLKRKLAIADATISVLDENSKDIMIHGWI